MKQKYEWYEDQRQIMIKFPIKGVSMKKIDIYMSDLVLKINVTDLKLVKLLDLKYEIDFESTQNHFVYIDQKLECTIIKKHQGLWQTLQETDLEKQILIQRRQDSFKRKEELDKKKISDLKSLKNQHDSFSVQEQMRIESLEKKQIESIKQQDEKEALNQIYSGIDESGNIKKKQSIENKNIDYSKFDDLKEESSDDSEKNQDDTQNDLSSELSLDDNEIFDFKESSLPQIRNTSKVDLKLTEKIYPHLASRENQSHNQPLPKQQSQIAQTSSDEQNPIWLKEKADKFMDNKDYYSALNAYCQVLKIDNHNLGALMNRQLVNMYLFNFDEVLRDCDYAIQYFIERQEVLQKTEMNLDQNSQKQFFKAYLRKSIALSWKGLLDDSLKLLEQLQQNSKFENIFQEFINQYDSVKQAIVLRKSQIDLKKQGDVFYKNAQLQQAKQIYEEALQIDQNNEILTSNLSIVNLKLDQYQECIDNCDLTMQKIEKLTKYSSFGTQVIGSSAFVLPLRSKILLRKAKSLHQLNDRAQAVKIVKKILENDEKNTETLTFQKQLKQEQDRDDVKQFKLKAAQHLKDNEIQQSLEIYQECLKKISLNNIEDIILYCSVLLNKSVCHLKNEEYDDIISTCLRGVKIIKNFRNRVISFQKTNKTDQDQLLYYEVRFLVRRGNAYLKQGQLYNALNEMEEALKIDPINIEIKKDIEKIRLQVQTI